MPAFYILIALSLMSAVIALTFLLAWRTLGRTPQTLCWALAFIAAAIHWIPALNMDRFPAFDSYWLVASPSMICFATLWMQGHCYRSDTGCPPRYLWFVAGALYAWIVWSIYGSPNVAAATTTVPAAVAIAMFLSAVAIAGQENPIRPAEIATVITMALFGLAQVAVASASILQGASGDEVFRAAAMSILFVSVPPGYTALAVFALFMVASDLSDEMKELAVRDQLTGLLNRRGFGEHSAQAYATARRNGTPVAVIMSDVDRFKNFNDDFGHAAGDDALCHFADILNEDRRVDDIIARIGGEEFALILPGTSLDDALRIADDLCERVQQSRFSVAGKIAPMTASFGVSVLSDKDTCLTDAIVRADAALYRSKRDGRNRVDLESSQKLRQIHGTIRSVSFER